MPNKWRKKVKWERNNYWIYDRLADKPYREWDAKKCE